VFIGALEPARLAAAERLETDREGALKQSYTVSLAERRYRAVDPDNRLVPRGLERAW
jgi:hypothetical protein